VSKFDWVIKKYDPLYEVYKANKTTDDCLQTALDCWTLGLD